VFGEIVRKLAAVECVRILVESPALQTRAHRILEKVGANLDAVEFFQRETDRAWRRRQHRRQRTGSAADHGGVPASPTEMI
jgi:hypothetical protein